MNGYYMFPDIYGYEHYVETPTAATEAFGIAGVMLGILVVFYFAVLAFGIVSYIL